MAFRFANQCPIVKCDFKPIGIDRCKEVFRFSWTDWRQIFDKLRFFLVIFIAAFLMQCQHHQLPILETQKIATFTFSLYFPHIFSFLRHRLFYMYACVKNSLCDVVLQVTLTICVLPSLLCFHCPFLGPIFLQITHSLLPVLLFLSFTLTAHPMDNTSFHPLFSPLFLLLAHALFQWFQFLTILFSVLSHSSCPAFCLTDVSTWLLCLRLPIHLENMSLYRFEQVLGFA